MVLATQAQAEKGVMERLVAKWAMVQKLFFRPLFGKCDFCEGGMNEGNEEGRRGNGEDGEEKSEE